MAKLSCPYCGSGELKRDPVGITIDTIEPIYYTDFQCKSCGKEFTIKNDGKNVLAIIKDYRVGGFYPDGIGLEGETQS